MTVVIDANGQLRELTPGEAPRAGDVIVDFGQNSPAATDLEAQLVTDDGETFDVDLDSEIASIFEQIEQGVDPTQNEEFATAAGGQNGSSPTGTGDVDRTALQTRASTDFDTIGLESQGLSETQSLALLDLVTEVIIADTLLVADTLSADNNAPEFAQASYAFSYNENRVDSDVLGSVSASDADGENVTYSISTNVSSGGNDLFEINPTSGAISLTAAGVSAFANDFELNPNVHNLVVTATEDAGLGTVQTATVSVALTELNLDDNAPEFAQASYAFSYNENRVDSDVLGTVSASDGDGENVTYSISTNISSGGNALFEINPTSGAISLTAAGVSAFANDFEVTDNVHNLVVTATEDAGLGTVQTATVNVALTELNLDDNAPEFTQASYAFSYNENRVDSDVLGSVSASDADGENVTYSISTNVSSGGNDLFEINPTSGAISLTAAGVSAFANDFELNPNVHNLVVTATEDAGLGTVKTATVSVALTELNLDDNAPEFGQASYAFSYNENRVDSDVLGSVSASDADGENVTYSISTNISSGGNALFEINPTSGAISLTAAGVSAFANDFELNPNVHNLVVTATEDAGLGTVKTATVSVALTELNLDDNAPEFGQASYAFSYNENRVDSDVLGSVSASDADGENVTYSISTNVSSGGNDLFEINPTSGAISLTAAGVSAFANDFELNPNVHNLVVTATEDAGLGTVQTATVSVALTELNLDDNAPEFAQASYAFSYNENRVDSDVLGTVSASDGDGENVTYSISTNISSGGNALFEINPTSGAISLTAAGVSAFANDFEVTDNVHNLVVTATEDAGLGTVQTATVNVALTELNLDGNAPEFTQASYAFSYNENRVDSDVLGTVSASDADGENVTYSISTNISSGGNALFEINPTSGAISLTAAGVSAFANDFEVTDNVHNLVVTATEDVGLGSVKTANVSVALTELNLDDNAPEFTQASYAFSYNENRVDSDVLGTVSASDADGENVTYSISTNISSGGNALFEINPTSGAISLTAAGVSAFANDFEVTDNVHNLVVTATEDAGLGSVQTATVNVALTELNLDDNAPEFGQASYAFSYNENRVDSDVLGSVSASDADGENVTYSISTNVSSGGNDLFEIDENSGDISLTAAGVSAFANDFELNPNVHNLVVTATEDAGLGSVQTANVNVALTELNLDDNAPEFAQASYAFSYNENRVDSDVLGTVSASDADGENVTYSISTNISSGGNALFEINPTSGAISLTAAGVSAFANDFELNPNVHNLVVTATEDAGLGTVKTATVSVALTELNLDENAPEFGQASYAFSYNENSTDSAVIGTVSASDGDGENVTYSISTNISSGGNALFEINPTSGAISLTAAGVSAFANDFELNPNVHNLVVTATEDAGLGTVQTATVNVALTELNLDDNAPEFGQASYAFSYNENSTDSAVIGSVSATDGDGENVTYSISTNISSGGNALFEINPTSGAISLTAAGVSAFANDFEVTDNVHNLVVTATEDAGLGSVKTANVSVALTELNLDDNAPEFTQASYAFSYNENSTDSAVIGTVSASDGDGENVTYSISTNISSGGNALFEINPTSGAISLTAAGVSAFANDFEVTDNVHNLVVTATEDVGLGSVKTANVSVALTELNLDDNAPEFTQASYAFSYNENSTDSAVIGSVSATDGDGENVTYSISTNISSGGNALFEINPTSGAISLTAAGVSAFANDFEVTDNVHNLVVTATEDAGLGSVKTATVSVALTELNLDDNAPEFAQASYAFSYNENRVDSDVLGTVSASDADGENVTYSISTNISSGGNALFEINPTSGAISLTAAGVSAFANDFEVTDNVHNLVVTATEDVGLGSVKTATVNVALTELNLDDNAPEFAQASYAFSYNENRVDSDVLGTVSASDADGENVTYSISTNISSGGNALFEINPTSGAISLTAAGVSAFANDFEVTDNVHNLVVTATEDAGLGSVKTATVSVALTELNLDDNAPEFTQASYAFSYNENSTDSAVIGTVSASDADGENVTYSISTNISSGGNALFEINPTSGAISLTAAGVSAFANDFEVTDNVHNLVVTATEDVGLGSVKTANVSVALTELNLDDNAPEFGQASYAFSYNENSTDSAVIGTVSASDGDGENVTYSISTNISSGGNALFEINPTSGAISLTAAGVSAFANDFELNPNVHNLVVTATEDAGLGSVQTATVNVALTELNLDDNAPEFAQASYAFSYNENRVDSDVLGSVSASDADGENVTYSISTNVSSGGNDLFEINPTSGAISLTAAGVSAFANDFELNPNVHNLVVTATEDAGLGTVKTATVSVALTELNLDDNAPEFGQASYAFSYNENRVDSDVLGSVSASDADGENVTYSISTNVSSGGNDLFEINPTSGAISLTAAGVSAFANDFELNPNVHNLVVTATEDAGLGTVQTATVSVALTELNLDDNAPEFAQASYAFSYNENRVDSDVLGTVSASDGDGENVTYSISTNISSGGNALFEINPTSGAISLTAAGVSAFANDFEVTDNVHNLVVTATEDAGLGTVQTATVNVALTELNLDGNAPEFTQASYAFSYNENRVDSDVLGTVSASDADGENVTYSISTNISSGGNALFEINPTSGAISLTAAGVSAFANDFEVTDNVHNLVVTATEDVGLGSVKTANVSVALTELNLDDNAPEFTQASYAFSYNENRVDSDVLGTVSASDADGENVTYSISTNISSGGNALFEINPTSGAISLTAAGVSAFANDFEVTDNVHNLVVTATEDAGLGSVQTATVNVALTELNLDDNAPEFGQASYAFSYNENRVDSDVLGSVSASDADGENVTYSISTNVSSGGNDLFEIDENSGDISLTAAGVSAFANDFELNPNVHNLVVTATEDAGLGSVQTANVNVALTELNLDDNAPEFAQASYAFSYNENRVDSDVLGTVSASDADGENVTYSISTNISSGGNALFEINPTSGAISLTAAGVSAFANDFELNPNVHNLVVTATEDAGLGTVKTATVSVALTELNLDENAPEFGQASYAFSYNENSTDSAVIGTVSASDGDGENVTYSISTNISSGGNALFEINPTSGAISLTAAGVSAFANDFELNPNVHNLVVTATEDAGLGTVQTATVNVALTELNLDDNAPEFTQASYAFSYNENRVDSDVLGTVSASDADGENVTYSISTNISSGGNALFEIDATSGAISLTAAGVSAFANDFEVTDNVHNLVVTATEDVGLGSVKTATVSVALTELNLDDNAPEFGQASYAFSYNENRVDSDVLGSVSASDADGENVTYSISTNVSSGGNALFEINPTSGAISLTAAGVSAFANDFELNPNVHNLVVTATEDAGLGSVQTATVNVALTELNLDDNAPEFTQASYAFSYNENRVDSDVLGTVSASDADGENVTYSISTNISSGGNALFEIDATSGAISLTAAGVSAFANDFEVTDNVHNLVVTATEDAGLGSVKTANVSVALTELNLDDNAPEFTQASYAFSYNENRVDSDVLGTVSASDADGENVTYSISTNISSGGNALFEIDATSGAISLTAAGVSAFANDFEVTDNVHNLVVTATEDVGLGSVKTATVSVALTELNLDDNAPEFGQASYAFSYNENRVDSDVLGTVSASDADGESVTYSISTNISSGGNALFEIDATSGAISLTAAGVSAFANDFEVTDNVHNLVVTATEDVGLGSVKTANVSVALTELNLDDNAPEFTQASYAFSYNENRVDSDVLGTVSASDADGENVTYSISTNVSSGGNALFEINPTSGAISLTAAGVSAFANDFELNPNVHNLVVTATEDAGLGSVQTATVNVALTELNLDDNAPEFGQASYAFSYNENSTDSAVIGSVSATDGDGESVTYSISTNISSGGNALFEINPTSGAISLTAAGVSAFANDFELNPNVHNLVVTATEDAGLGSVQTATVNVALTELNLDDNAPEFTQASYAFSYNENSTDSAVIGTVSASDGDGENVTYSISTNISSGGNALFEIDATSGAISLTAAGVSAFTNNFEALSNIHNIVVTATEATGFGAQKSTDVNVMLSEDNVNELPIAESFSIDADNLITVPVIFDSNDVALDRISDEDDDFNSVKLNVMITSLPTNGTLLYTEQSGDTRVLTASDLHTIGQSVDNEKLLNPDNISYVPGAGPSFEIGYSGDPANIMLNNGFFGWGVYVSDTERLITLDNGNTVGVSITGNNGKPLKQYTGNGGHVGWGIGDTDGSGMNKQETLIIDLSGNPLDVVTFGLDGLGGAFTANSNVYVEVTYTFVDNTTHVEQYQKDPGHTGNSQILYDFTYSSPNNPIVSMELTSTGGSWELRYLSGSQQITEDVTFDYIAVDSNSSVSSEATVTIDVNDSPQYGVIPAANEITAQLGNQILLGDSSDNVFKWLDSTLDSGTDVIKNFDLGTDLLDFRDILNDNNVEVADLINNIELSVDENDVVLTVSDDGTDQTVILEGVISSFEAAGLIVNDTIVNELNTLTQILKVDS